MIMMVVVALVVVVVLVTVVLVVVFMLRLVVIVELVTTISGHCYCCNSILPSIIEDFKSAPFQDSFMAD